MEGEDVVNPLVNPIQSLTECGTKLWLDSVEPEAIRVNQLRGATGATANPAIISKIIQKDHYDKEIVAWLEKGHTDEEVAWLLTDHLVSEAQQVFLPAYEQTRGNDGYVSFELDPLIEDPERRLPHAARVRQYVELGKKWSQGHGNRMIKVPATLAGLDALEELSAAGVTINVTLMFTGRQYRLAREAIWRGAQRRSSLAHFKSVYSVFVSRIDVYTAKHVHLSPEARGQAGIVIAKRIWMENRAFWKALSLPLQQEIIFASTGTKDPAEDPSKYVLAFAGSDIETNPPATIDAFQAKGGAAMPAVELMPPKEVLEEIDRLVDQGRMEEVLLEEGIRKFAEPQKQLLALIAEKRNTLRPAPTGH